MAEKLELKSLEPFDVNEGIKNQEPAALGVCRLPSSKSDNFLEVPIFSAAEYAQQWVRVSKAYTGGLTALAKDLAATLPPYTQSFGRISMMPNNQTSELGVLQWPGLPPETLEKLGREMIAPQMIVNERCNDVLKYSQISKHPWRPGWEIVPINDEETDPNQNIDAVTRREIRKAEQFLLNSGEGEEFQDPRTRDALQRRSFSQFLLEIVRNSLTFDGIAIWTQCDVNGEIMSYAPMPAQNIRLLARPDRAQLQDIREGTLDFYGAATRQDPFSNSDIDPDHPPFAVAVDETNNIVQKFTRKELIWYVRNPRVDATVCGYGFSELEMSLILVTGLNNAIKFNCYSEDTEVLTKTGWKLFKDVDIAIDEFATLNTENGEFEWQKSYNKIWKEYEGDMYKLTSRSIDMLVTPEHKLLLQSIPKANIGGQTWHATRNGKTGRIPNKDLYRTETAEDLYKSLTNSVPKVLRDKFPANSKYSMYWNIPVTSNWTGTKITPKTFISGRGNIINCSGDDYCRLLGAYLSEGSVLKVRNKYNGAISIAQEQKTKGYNQYKDLITRLLDEEPYYTGHAFNFNNIELANHLTQFGNDCYTKIIPDEIMNATPEQIKLFWDYMTLGDGSIKETNGGKYKTERRGRLKGKRPCIGTTSKIMAGQLQELATKIGYSASINTRPAQEMLVPVLIKKAVGDWEYSIDSRRLTQTAEFYDVQLKAAKAHPFTITKTTYKGFVGCITVPNHTVYVRRNNKVAWSRQSDLFNKNSIPKGILAVHGNFSQRQFDALGRIWDNLQRGPNTDWTLPAIQISEKGGIEVINLEPLRKEPIYYNNLINLFSGVMATIYNFPVHRLGFKISGTERDSRPDTPKPLGEEDDQGLPGILTHIELLINGQIFRNKFPALQFRFTGKSLKEDARFYEARMLAATVDEKRALVGLPAYRKVAAKTPQGKMIADLMGMAPSDPSLTGIYQSIIAAGAKANWFGESTGNGEGGDQNGGDAKGVKETPGALFPSKKDPAKGEQHGHLSGVRRDSKLEGEHAKQNKAVGPPTLRRLTQTYSSVDKS